MLIPLMTMSAQMKLATHGNIIPQLTVGKQQEAALKSNVSQEQAIKVMFLLRTPTTLATMSWLQQTVKQLRNNLVYQIILLTMTDRMGRTMTLPFAILKAMNLSSIVGQTRGLVPQVTSAYVKQVSRISRLINRYSHLHLQVWIISNPFSIDSSLSGYALVENSDVTCTRVWTLADCEEAAQQLGLPDSSVEDDGQVGKDYDPPYCYFEDDKLKFNNGTNTGPCTTSDKCLCVGGNDISFLIKIQVLK